MINGVVKSGYDIRDYWYDPTDKGAFDWSRGYDIEEVIKTKLKAKAQGKSGSCGGQAWSYYMAVLEKVATGKYAEHSARWIYSHTFVPPSGGSRGRDNCAFVIKTGSVEEELAPSYDGQDPPSEAYMRSIPVLDQHGKEDVEVSKALSYLQVKPNIELFAQAIQDNYGLVLVLNGEDNGTWRTSFPKPPKIKEWGHFVYAGKARLINGEKYIAAINSWGDKVGKDGWQWIGEDYFNSGHVREAWTLAWNYQPAKHKLILKEIVRKLQKVVKLYKEL